MRKKIAAVLFISILAISCVYAQDDLLLIAGEGASIKKEKVTATFKSTKVINAQTNETVYKRTLDFRVGHRFGNFGGASGGGYENNLFGLYQIADVRIAFEYGITDRLTIGLSNNKKNRNFEGLVKFRLLEQRKDNSIPFAITLFGSASVSTKKNGDFSDIEREKKALRRVSYVSQVILARKFGQTFSCALLPTYVHRNYVEDFNDENGTFALGFAARIKITKSFALVGDYFYNFSKFHDEARNSDGNRIFYQPLGLGLEVETGGHVFTIMATNSAGIIEKEFVTDTRDTWTKGGFKFSFNISRNFRL